MDRSPVELCSAFLATAIIILVFVFYFPFGESTFSPAEIKIHDREFGGEMYRIFIYNGQFQVIPLKSAQAEN